ncbi:MAG: c-type cytochrome [Nitrospinae bacterium]|nr:c-type cytochrome [Nitrospinota bacterium]
MTRIIALIAAALVAATLPATAAITPSKPKPPKSPALLERGAQIYYQRCSFCHGMEGGGDGPAAEFLNPRPRNFKTNVFKFRSTGSGALPLDEDLFETISKGVRGTAMQTFDNEVIKNGLSEEDRWAVIYHIQTFTEVPDFSLWTLDEEYAKASDPADKALHRYNQIMKIGDPPASSPEIIAKGKEIYKKAKCFQCHGDEGKGNGVSAPGMKDDWKFPIVPRDLTKEWTYKGGSSVKEVFFRFTTGLNGTPMPSFANSIPEDERWALAHYVHSLQYSPSEERNLNVRRISGELPSKADDPAWDNAERLDVRLTGNVLIKPRWQNITVDLVKVRALYNDKEIAFRLEWNDRFANVIHEGTDELHQLDASRPGDTGNLQTYVPIYSPDYQPGRYRDAVMLQFPQKISAGSEKPHFLNGDSGHAVNLWWWRADYDPAAAALTEAQRKRFAEVESRAPSDGSATPAVKMDIVDLRPEDVIGKEGRAAMELNAKGFMKAFTTQPDESQTLASSAVFNDGTWTLVLKRSLTTEDKNDTQFEPGVFIPLAVNAWDGWNKDTGMQKSISSWYFVYLEKPMPLKVYVITAIAFFAIIGLELRLSKLWRRREDK